MLAAWVLKVVNALIFKLMGEWGQHLRDQAPLSQLNFQLLKLVYLVITVGKQRIV